MLVAWFSIGRHYHRVDLVLFLSVPEQLLPPIILAYRRHEQQSFYGSMWVMSGRKAAWTDITVYIALASTWGKYWGFRVGDENESRDEHVRSQLGPPRTCTDRGKFDPSSFRQNVSAPSSNQSFFVLLPSQPCISADHLEAPHRNSLPT